MKLYSNKENYTLYQGNMLDMLEVIDLESIDSIVTDPPYELNFMNKGWDNSGIAFQKETWKKCYEVLKPGGYLLAFGGSRTFHRIACAIEDAGFEIRDTIMWLYGSGFPKSMNLGLKMDKKQGCPDRGHRIAVANRHHPDGTLEPNGEKLPPYEPKTSLGEKWNGWGTALKPSFEPIIVARKPFKGSLVDNVIEYGVGGINIDECRVDFVNDEDYKITANKNQHEKFGTPPMTNNNVYGDYSMIQPKNYSATGRFPANTILTYDETDFDEVCGSFPNTKSTYNINGKHEKVIHRNNADTLKYGYKTRMDSSSYNDSGSASRYFYCAKASKKDRDEGLDDFDKEKVNDGRNTPIDNAFQRGETLRKNTHPTVKPTELMQYLIRLVTPQGGVILDPFNGSGSTGKAVMYENKEHNKNYKYVGIELSDEYLSISQARIDCVNK